MKALIEAAQAPSYPAEIVCVLSNYADAAGLLYAQAQGISTAVISHSDFANRDDFEAALVDKLDTYGVELVCLAGFMRLLKGAMLERFPDKIMNIHPSLLPAYKGLNVHERVIEAQEEFSGCSVHIVHLDMDAGPVLVQKQVPVIAGDTPETLADRILEQEHLAYPEGLALKARQMLSE